MPLTKDASCPKCGYHWEPRVSKPKACPRCKQRLDTPKKKGGKRRK